MDSMIERLNEYLEQKSKITGGSRTDVLMELALEAGIEDFNPYKADDIQLEEIVKCIPQEYIKKTAV